MSRSDHQDPVEFDVKHIITELQNVKTQDMHIATDIAALANVTVRDSNHDLLPFVWSRKCHNQEQERASLLPRDMVQSTLHTVLKKGIDENMPLLQKVSDPTVLVDWIVHVTEAWELRYAQKRAERFDIGSAVLAAMYEVVSCHVVPFLEQAGFDRFRSALDQKIERALRNPDSQRAMRTMLEAVKPTVAGSEQKKARCKFWLHRTHHAYTRFMFRANSSLRDDMCLIAAKLLQKQQVCNKPGTYSSRTQTALVNQEYDIALVEFQNRKPPSVRVQELLNELHAAEDAWFWHVLDHASVRGLEDAMPVPELVKIENSKN